MHNQLFIFLFNVVILVAFVNGRSSIIEKKNGVSDELHKVFHSRQHSLDDDAIDKLVKEKAIQLLKNIVKGLPDSFPKEIFDKQTRNNSSKPRPSGRPIENNMRQPNRGFTPGQRKFQLEMLAAHNEYRARHCAPPIQLDDRLSRDAQDYAQRMAGMNRMVHSGTKRRGENISTRTASSPLRHIDGAEETKRWYDEVLIYDFNKEDFNMDTDHFSQIVWKGTTTLGVGVAFARGGRTIYVAAQYFPQGNILGEYRENVSKAKC